MQPLHADVYMKIPCVYRGGKWEGKSVVDLLTVNGEVVSVAVTDVSSTVTAQNPCIVVKTS
jgi:hypothetical protein